LQGGGRNSAGRCADFGFFGRAPGKNHIQTKASGVLSGKGSEKDKEGNILSMGGQITRLTRDFLTKKGSLAPCVNWGLVLRGEGGGEGGTGGFW